MSGGFNELAQIAAELEQAAFDTLPKVVGLLQEQGDQLAELQRSLCPVGETHRLEDSIWATVDPVNLSVEVGPYAFYGRFVELGTAKMGPQPFVGPSADEFEERWPAALSTLGGEVL